MAITYTSSTPATGPATGGTNVVIVGTGLLSVDDVEFGVYHGTINTAVTNTDTSLTVIAPAVPSTYVAPVKITLTDVDLGVIAQSPTNFTYSAVTAPPLTSSPAAKWRFDVDSSVALDGSTWAPVRGVTDFQPALATATTDDSDYDSVDPVTGVSYGSDAKTQLKWSIVAKVSRKRAAGYVEDPGQKLLYAAHDQVGAAGQVHVRWYDRNGHGSEAYDGFGLVEWSEDGGSTTALSMVSITIMGQGKRNKITNPVS